MLPWKPRKCQILPVNPNLSLIYFPLAKFQLVSCNPSLAISWQMTYTQKLPKLCSATLNVINPETNVNHQKSPLGLTYTNPLFLLGRHFNYRLNGCLISIENSVCSCSTHPLRQLLQSTRAGCSLTKMYAVLGNRILQPVSDLFLQLHILRVTIVNNMLQFIYTCR